MLVGVTAYQVLLQTQQCYFLMASCNSVPLHSVSFLFIPGLGFSVAWLLSVRVTEALVGISQERSY